MKRTVCFILCSALIISFLFSASMFLALAEREIVLETSEELVIPIPEISKSEFAAQCKERFNQSENKKSLSTNEAYELINLYTSGIDYVYYEEQLNEAGLYVYSSVISESDTTRSTVDAAFTNGATVYSAAHGLWITTFRGEWVDLSAISDEISFVPFPSVGKEITVGAHDTLAIEFFDTSGDTPRMLDSFIRISDSNILESKITRGPTDYHERSGVIYRFEDYVKINNVKLFGYDSSYYGAAFSITIIHDSTFENFEAKSRAAYIHSWDRIKP